MLRCGLLMALVSTQLGCYAGYIQGDRWDEARQCWWRSEDASFSWHAHGGQDPAMTCARSPEGDLWMFSSTTIPDDFVEVACFSPEGGYPRSDKSCE